MSIFARPPLQGQPEILGTPVVGPALQRFMSRGQQDFSLFYEVYKDGEKAKATLDYLKANATPETAREFVKTNRNRLVAYYLLKPHAEAALLESKSGRAAAAKGVPPRPMPNLQPGAAKAAERAAP